MTLAPFKQTDLRKISFDAINRRLDRVRRLNLQEAEFSVVRRLTLSALDGYLTQYVQGIFTGIWRARKNPPSIKFGHVRELWYPPRELITKMGRLNALREPVLYASSTPQIAVAEVRPKTAEIVTLLLVAPRATLAIMDFAHVGLAKSKAIEIERIARLLPRSGSTLRRALRTQANFNKWLKLDDYLNETFTVQVAEGEEWRYKATLAMAQMFFDMPDCHGINYPSVEAKLNGTNMCFKPEIADKHLVPRQAVEVEIAGLTDHSVFIRPLRCCPMIGGDGTIIWQGPERANEILR